MSPGELRYELRRIDSYDELVDRLVIDWRGRNWVQFMNSREVVEIRPRGFVRDFPGFDDVLLTFDELKRIVSAPDANHAWHDRLGAVAGVYLIVDTTSGDLYVGSASGANGIIGRWTSYATSAHGGNKLLKELLAKDASRHHAFTFSILRTLPLQTSKEEVFKAESFFKNKFGRKAISLNAN